MSNKLLNGTGLVMGTCYYPEHWDKALWREDLQRMLDTGITVVRIGEFAWNLLEPEEGVFTFTFFDEFLDLAEEMGMKVIMGTPTATPPAWLTEKYPETLNVSKEGVLYRHGMRRHYNYNSPVYLEKCAIIAEKSASHYAGRTCVIGWQIDNELNCEASEFYSESDTTAFRVFLQEKYQTLDKLNEAWGTVFWNQTYTDWKEIYVPRPTNSNATNPHQTLDYIRFISYSTRRFLKLQSDIVRKYLKEGDFITTNGLFGHIDYQKAAEESLDFITYDSYPNFAYCITGYNKDEEAMRDRWWSYNLSETRAISPVFGIMEQQSGANGWNTHMEAPTPRTGQITLWTMQSVAHGADYISYFRWRTCTMGTEIYWHGILDYSGRENRRLREIKQISQKMQKLKELSGGVYEAKVAVLKDYDNLWDAEYDVFHKRVANASQDALFAAAQLTHTPMDHVYLTDRTTAGELGKYQVIFYPHPTIITDEQVKVLEQYVSEGGMLVLGCRSGYKDITGKCVMDYLPGKLAGLTGVDIPEYSFIAPDSKGVFIRWDDDCLKGSVFMDQLAAVGNARVEAEYTSDVYEGAGAIVCNEKGRGRVYYYGSAFNRESAECFLRKLGVISPYADIIRLPKQCELAVRTNERGSWLFVLNYAGETAELEICRPMENVFTGELLEGKQTLEKYGVMVLKM